MAESSFDPQRLLILFGSETGYAQDQAELIAREAQRRRYAPAVYAMDEYKVINLPSETLVVFVCSTTGQGDTPENMKSFWRFLLRRNLPASSLKALQYSVFGLGDSSYAMYNAVAKRLYRRLQQLGGTPIVPLGLGDDQHQLGLYGGPEGLDAWLESLWDDLATRYPLPTGIVPRDPGLKPDPCFLIEVDESTSDSSSSRTSVTQTPSGPPYHLNKPFPAKMLVNKRLTSPDHFQDVRHIEFDIEQSGIEFNTADVVQVLPETLPDVVDGMVTYLGMSGDTVLRIRPNPACEGLRPKSELQTPPTCTLRHLLQHYLEVEATPRRSFFELAAHFATDEDEIDRLRYFGSSEGQNDLMSYAERPRRTILETLLDFPTLKIPITYLLDIIPRLRPRSFSICSSSKMFPGRIHIVMAVVKYKTFLAAPRRGICSTWLSGIPAGEGPLLSPSPSPLVRVWCKPSTIVLPSVDCPLILIGPGTGLAALRAIIQDRIVAAKSNEGQTIGGVTLISGHRSSTKDWLYADEFNTYLKENSDVFQNYFTAFSRDQDAKLYVQYRIKENGKLLYDLMHPTPESGKKPAHIIISGNAKAMPLDVRLAWRGVLQAHGGLDDEGAEERIREWESKKRYQTETW